MFSFDFRQPHEEFTQNTPAGEQNLHLGDINQEQEMFFQLSPSPKAALGRSYRRRKAPAAQGMSSVTNWAQTTLGKQTLSPLAHPPAALWPLFWWGECRVPPPAGPAESDWWSRKSLLWFCLHLLSLKEALPSLWSGKIGIKNKMN